jgi:hypothetical protein
LFNNISCWKLFPALNCSGKLNHPSRISPSYLRHRCLLWRFFSFFPD